MVWREGGCCATFDGGGSTASVFADVSCASSYAGARHGVARGWLLCYLRRRRLIGAALASTLACVMVWREGGCCATFDGGGSTVAVLADAGSARLRLVALFLRLALAFYAGVRCPRRAPHGQTRGDLYSCSAACHLLLCGLYHFHNTSPRLAALGSKPRVRCPRRAPHGQTRGDLYSGSAACHLLLCGLLPLPIRARAWRP